MTECSMPNPGISTVNGRELRCTEPAGHDGDHRGPIHDPGGMKFGTISWAAASETCDASSGQADDPSLVYVCTLPPGHSGMHWDGIEGWEW